MTDRTLKSKVSKLQELQAKIDTMTTQAEALRDAIKAEMQERSVDEYKAGAAVVRWREVQNTRLDTKALKAAHSSLYEQFAVTTTYRRFQVIGA